MHYNELELSKNETYIAISMRNKTIILRFVLYTTKNVPASEIINKR